MDMLETNRKNLLDKLNLAESFDDIKECIESEYADDEVLKLAVIKASDLEDKAKKNLLAKLIISSSNVTADVLICILVNRLCLFKEGIISIVQSPAVNEAVLRKVVEIHTYTFGRVRSTVINEEINEAVISSSMVTPDILISILDRYPINSNILLKVVQSPKANETVLNKVIERISNVCTSREERYPIIREITSSSVVTREILISLLEKYWITIEEFKCLISSFKADDIVLSFAEGILPEIGYPLRQQAYDAIKEKKLEIRGKKSNDSSLTIESDKIEDYGVRDAASERVMVNKNEDIIKKMRNAIETGINIRLQGDLDFVNLSCVERVDPTYTMFNLDYEYFCLTELMKNALKSLVSNLSPPQWYSELCTKCLNEPDKKHVLFIGELESNGYNGNLGFAYIIGDLIENRRVYLNDKWKLPDNCSIVCMNRAVSRDLSKKIAFYDVEIPFDMEDFVLWALKTNPKTGKLNIHPLLLSFCVFSLKLGFSMDFKHINKIFPDFMSVEKLSNDLYTLEMVEGNISNINFENIKAIVGKYHASNFMNYITRFPLDIKNIENEMYTADNFVALDDKIFALGFLICDDNIDIDIAKKFIVTCLGEEYLSIYIEMRNQRDAVLLELSLAEKKKK